MNVYLNKLLDIIFVSNIYCIGCGVNIVLAMIVWKIWHGLQARYASVAGERSANPGWRNCVIFVER